MNKRKHERENENESKRPEMEIIFMKRQCKTKKVEAIDLVTPNNDSNIMTTIIHVQDIKDRQRQKQYMIKRACHYNLLIINEMSIICFKYFYGHQSDQKLRIGEVADIVQIIIDERLFLPSIHRIITLLNFVRIRYKKLQDSLLSKIDMFLINKPVNPYYTIMRGLIMEYHDGRYVSIYDIQKRISECIMQTKVFNEMKLSEEIVIFFDFSTPSIIDSFSRYGSKFENNLCELVINLLKSKELNYEMILYPHFVESEYLMQIMAHFNIPAWFVYQLVERWKSLCKSFENPRVPVIPDYDMLLERLEYASRLFFDINLPVGVIKLLFSYIV